MPSRSFDEGSSSIVQHLDHQSSLLEQIDGMSIANGAVSSFTDSSGDSGSSSSPHVSSALHLPPSCMSAMLTIESEESYSLIAAIIVGGLLLLMIVERIYRMGFLPAQRRCTKCPGRCLRWDKHFVERSDRYMCRGWYLLGTCGRCIAYEHMAGEKRIEPSDV